jgi:isochorismate synthase
VFLPRVTNDEDEEQTAANEDVSFLRQAFSERLPAGRHVLVVTVRAPNDSLEKFLRLVPREGGFLWRSAHGRMAGSGEAVALRVAGDDRLLRLREMATGFWSRLHVVTRDGLDVKPVLFGGIAFAPNVPPIEPWSEFTNDTFTLARWTYGRRGSDSYLSVALREDELRDLGLVTEVLATAEKLLDQLRTEAATTLIQHMQIPASAVHHISLSEWTTHIDAVLSAIRSGEYSKIVAARRCVVDLDRPLEDTGFIARLSAAYCDCTHFAVRREESTFLGATPETLFRKQGNTLTTHALAGTKRVADDPTRDYSAEGNALRRSSKDLEEHALVVKRICDELWPLCKKLRFTSTPQVRQVRNLVHLQTPITAELRPDTHVFDLLSAFHPTPAVGGFPARAAADWIRSNEPLERGWYTGALGWFDASGDAEFAVAIRCGVVTPKRVYIFAGAGIVEKSDAESEYKETAAKMHPILRALGVSI